MAMKKRTKVLYFIGGPVPTLDDEHRKVELEHAFRADVVFRNGSVPNNGRPEQADYVYGNDVDGKTTIPADYDKYPIIGADLTTVMQPSAIGEDTDTNTEMDPLAAEIGNVGNVPPPQTSGGWGS